MELHLQPEWQRTLGQYVEIRRCGKVVRTGTVDAVMTDDSILWVSFQGVNSRTMVERADGNEVYVGYAWSHNQP